MIPTILLTFDVEDWFQVENFKQCIPFSSWPNCELRVEKNVHRILDLLDSINCNTAAPQHSSTAVQQHLITYSLIHSLTYFLINPINPSNSNHSNKSAPQQCNTATPKNSFTLNTQHLTLKTQDSPKATFFVLGWIAERLPHLVREIQARGHEVASHGYDHDLCQHQSVKDLKSDLTRSKMLLEDIIGESVYGYRAPSFSINDQILHLIKETGYLYDSSFNSFGLHTRYGQINLNGNGRNGILQTISDNFFELPVSNLKLLNRILPWGGGGYFRLLPLPIFYRGVQSILKKQGAYLFYLHPWEVDPEQPRISMVSKSFKFRHYVNLNSTFSKLSNLLKSFNSYRFLTCSQYITEVNQQT